MFADLHHLHQFVSLDQGGYTFGYNSAPGGTEFTSYVGPSDGQTDTYFGESLDPFASAELET